MDNKTLNTLLCKRDLMSLLYLMNASLHCTREEDLTKLMHDLREIVPHTFAIIGLAEIGDGDNFKSYKTLNIDYPKDWIELYTAKKYNLCDPIFATNFTKLGLQQWHETYKVNPPSRKFLSDAHDFGLIAGYTFGIKSRSEKITRCSLFSISGRSIEPRKNTNAILETVMPHFHQALLRVTNRHQEKESQTAAINISPREREVLVWLKEGKSSWDVAKILNISERTVNYHVGNIIQKLGAVSRLHAVAIAVGMKLIDLD